ncbi:MAG: hypothetical protein RTU09_10945 [Candidatus Thorarchaeota archaeon]
MFEWVFYFIVYMCAGFTLKLGDDLLDEMEQSTFAWLPLAISGILFGYLMTQTEWDLALFTAIIIGVVLSGKVNRPQFAIGFFFIALTILVIGIPVVTDWLAWSALLFMLFMASMLDEKGNDWTDEEIAPAAFKFFQYRFALKLSVLLLTIPWPEFLAAAVGLWMFDLGYELAGWITRYRH